MDVDEDDDFYAPEDAAPEATEEAHEAPKHEGAKPEQEDEDLEEGEEEDEEEDDDSDIEIVTERKDGSKAAPPAQAKYNEIRNISQSKGSGEVVTKAAVKKESKKAAALPSGADLPGIAMSKIDVDAKPLYEPAGKPITQVNIDEDLPENEKPWRRPGTDMTDYFNYGFDEFTWALYSSKQESLRTEFNSDKIAQSNKKMLEDMNMMMAMGAMPGMVPGAQGGMEGMDMNAMQQMMMASGMDPSQMDSSAMFAAMQGGQGGANAAAGQGGNQGQNFGGGQAGFGQGQGQYGFDQQGGGEAGRGRNFGRGRGRRGW